MVQFLPKEKFHFRFLRKQKVLLLSSKFLFFRSYFIPRRKPKRWVQTSLEKEMMCSM